MRFATRGWVIACLLAAFGCFSESGDTDDDDDDDETTGNTADPTLTTTVDPSVTTSMTSATTTSMTTVSSDPTSDTDPSLDTTDSDSDSDPDTTTSGDGCPEPGDAVCDDGTAVVGELCFLEPQAREGGAEQIGPLAIADIDDDGFADVAFTDGADGFVSFAAGGELQNATPVLGGQVSTWSVDIGKLGDEVAVAFGGVNAEVVLARFSGLAYDVDAPIAAPGPFVTARFADFTGDNRLDLLVGSEESSELYLHVNDGADVYGVELNVLDVGAIPGIADMRVLHGAKAPGLAILTRDGRLIRAASDGGGLGGFEVIDADQTYGSPTTGRLAAGDLNADGDTDLAVGFDGRAFVFRASEIGFMAVQSLGDSMTGNVVPYIADIDNDGAADLAIADPDEMAIEVYIADENGFAEREPLQVPALPRGLGVADFNQDCAADVVALGPNWFEVSESNP